MLFMCSTYLWLLLAHVGLALIPAVRNIQESLQISQADMSRKQLYGHNDARYCGVPDEEQLFKISEFDVSPRPPATDTRLFAFLKGGVQGVSEADLAEAVLKTSMKHSDGRISELEDKFAAYPQMIVRHDLRQYSKLLKPGVNEVIGDMVFYSWWTPKGSYNFKVEAKVPDGRTLFCFEFDYDLDGTA